MSIVKTIKDLHYDSKRKKPSWSRIIPTVLAVFGLAGLLMAYLLAFVSYATNGSVDEVTVQLVVKIYEGSLMIFGVSIGGYGVGALSSVFIKGDAYGSQINEEESQ